MQVVEPVMGRNVFSATIRLLEICSLTLVLILIPISITEADIRCGCGEFLVEGLNERPDRCESCPKHTYQDNNDHRKTQCKSCSPFNHPQQSLTINFECIPCHYHITECIDGYYVKEGSCHKCTICSLNETVRACRKDHDTVCFTCGCGEYLERGGNGQADRCKPCGSGFYQDKENHMLTKCRQCTDFDEFNHLHEYVVKKCTQCQDTLIKCYEDFYYSEGQCKSCTVCSDRGKKQGQACQNFQDTICCDTEKEVVRDGKCEVEPDSTTPGPHQRTTKPHPDKSGSAPAMSNEPTTNGLMVGMAVIWMLMYDMSGMNGVVMGFVLMIVFWKLIPRLLGYR